MAQIGSVCSCYHADNPRVRRVAEALVAAGPEVKAICVQRDGKLAPTIIGSTSDFYSLQGQVNKLIQHLQHVAHREMSLSSAGAQV